MAGFASSLVLVAALCGAEQAEEFNVKKVKNVVFDKERKDVPDIWMLDFKFRNPRYIMAEVPGKGRQLVWYMTYSVTNPNPEAHRFIPRFTLVTDKGEVYHDVIMPQAEKAIMLREDPTRPLLNSVTIAKDIPPSGPEADPTVRYGVAIFEGVDMSAKAFNIYVTGLSNGYVKVEDPKTNEEKMRRKTLELRFAKPGDVYNPHEREIRFLGDSWIYR